MAVEMDMLIWVEIFCGYLEAIIIAGRAFCYFNGVFSIE